MRGGWHKSTHSASSHCVEVNESFAPDVIGVRDTKDLGDGPVLGFASNAWAPFVAAIRDGHFGFSQSGGGSTPV